MDSGVATRPIADMTPTEQQLTHFVYHSGSIMQPVFEAAKQRAQARGLRRRRGRARAARGADRGRRGPGPAVLVGRARRHRAAHQSFGLRLEAGQDFELVNPDSDPRYREVPPRLLPAACAATASRREAASGDAQPHHADRPRCCCARATPMRMLCGTVGAIDEHLGTCAT